MTDEYLIPIRVFSSKREVSWWEINKRDLIHPFFEESVSRRAEKRGRLTPIQTDISALAMSNVCDLDPAFIFHISRCGSTLLSNSARAAGRPLVLSEPSVISHLLGADVNPGLRGVEFATEELICGVINAYSRLAESSNSQLVIKFTSWNILFLPLLRTLFPRSRVAIVVRDPLEVAVSCINAPPGWAKWRNSKPEIASAVFGWTVKRIQKMTASEYVAGAIGAFLQAAKAQSNIYLFDYQHISEANILKVLAYLNITPAPSGRARILNTLKVYSKDPGGTTIFSPDSQAKRMAAPKEMIDQVNQLARPYYNQLFIDPHT